ncbi:MAG: DUF423 domain-containing protein [Chitinophagaceae bacterium]|nr:MAG: DUF423 domain-containing protein [Chitinophagaceae bacterium]
MHRGFLLAGTVFSFLAVAFGAFAAHALERLLSIKAMNTFETGVRYQFYHSLALLFTGLLFKYFPVSTVKWAGRFFITGIILFSFSLYFLSILQSLVVPGYKWFGIITPFGGIAFLCGWSLLFYTFIKWQKTL